MSCEYTRLGILRVFFWGLHLWPSFLEVRIYPRLCQLLMCVLCVILIQDWLTLGELLVCTARCQPLLPKQEINGFEFLLWQTGIFNLSMWFWVVLIFQNTYSCVPRNISVSDRPRIWSWHTLKLRCVVGWP